MRACSCSRAALVGDRALRAGGLSCLQLWAARTGSRYRNELLEMSLDVGARLLKAFDSKTGIPYSRVNLRHGLDKVALLNQATCTACAGTLLLEFSALSRYSGDGRFEQVRCVPSQQIKTHSRAASVCCCERGFTLCWPVRLRGIWTC
jgi:hypothetical protein